MNSSIFKAYDIRGIFPEDIDKDAAVRIGRALVLYTGAKKVAVGYDMRKSSPELEAGLISGITDQGSDVIRIGLSSTPMAYFASWKLDVDASVIITASHNPAQWNGMKMCKKNAVPIGEGDGMEEINEMAIKGEFPEVSKKGTVEENNELKREYLNYIAGFFKKCSIKKKVVIDFANSMGIGDKDVYEKISENVEAVFMYDDFDGTFPNHEANPLKIETLSGLQKKVIEEKADLGIAYDGDADRIGFVSEDGEIIPMDYIIAILSEEILKKYPNGLVLMDLRSSNAVKEVIEEAGGRVNRCRVGHSLIKKQMREEGAIFAGELSGHYFFEENSKSEMATLAAIMILNLLNETGQKMSELVKNLKRYYHSGEINSDVENKREMMEKLKKIYNDGRLDELDGIRIDYPDWWFNVRPSNTEPVIRLNVEAKNKGLMEEKRDELLKIIRE
jgi:phosphomannomutase